MSRWKAAGIHFSLSVAIAAALIVLMLALWYPPPYFKLMGGAMLIVLIAGCDVVLGPLITLIIFKSGKKGLVFDLAVIGFVQAAALTYGFYNMFEARPVYAVFAVDRFEVVSANEIDPEGLARASNPEFQSLPWTGPRIVGATMPSDQEERWNVAKRGDIKAHPRLYVDYESIAADAARRARSLDGLARNPSSQPAEAAVELARFADRGNDVGYVPMVGRFHDMSVILDRRSGRIEAIVDAEPW